MIRRRLTFLGGPILGLRRPVLLAGSAFAILLVIVLIGIGLAIGGTPRSTGPSATAGNSGACAGYPDQCGDDYRVRTSMEDSATGQTAFLVTVNEGMTRSRAEEIARGFASRHGQAPVVVYVIPQSVATNGAGFGGIPNPLTSANLQDVPDPAYNNWILTYVAIPMVSPLERWGPGSAGMALRP